MGVPTANEVEEKDEIDYQFVRAFTIMDNLGMLGDANADEPCETNDIKVLAEVLLVCVFPALLLYMWELQIMQAMCKYVF